MSLFQRNVVQLYSNSEKIMSSTWHKALEESIDVKYHDGNIGEFKFVHTAMPAQLSSKARILDEVGVFRNPNIWICLDEG